MDKLDYLITELINENQSLKKITIPDDINEKKILYRALRNIREPKPISLEYLHVQDEYLKEEVNSKVIVDEKSIPSNLDIISIWQGDIITLKCDAIVNACNSYLLGCFIPNHNCIDNAIHSFAGIELREECNNIMQGKILPNGEVILTHGYNLPSKYVIETVGPQIISQVSDKDRTELSNCYYNTLELCKKNNIKTVAFPCISTGVYGFPKSEASIIAIKVVRKYLKDNPNIFEHIIFNVFTDEDLKIYQNNLLKENLDD